MSFTFRCGVVPTAWVVAKASSPAACRRRFGLPQMLPGVPGKYADDSCGHDGSGNTKDANERRNFGHFADDLGLHLLGVSRDAVTEEQLVFFVAGQLSLVGE